MYRGRVLVLGVRRNDAQLPAVPNEERCWGGGGFDPRIIDMIPERELAEEVKLRIDLAIFAEVLPASVLEGEVRDELLKPSDMTALPRQCGR